MKRALFAQILCIVVLSLSMGVATASKYSCNYVENGVYHSTYYTTGQSAETECAWQKKFSQKDYNDCIADFAATQRAFKNGKCRELIVKKETIGSSACEVELTKNSKGYVSISCSGKDNSKAMEILKEKYGSK